LDGDVSCTPEWTDPASIDAMLRHVVQDEVKQAIDALPETYRLPVLLADLAECSYQEIATIIGCPMGTVMSRLFRGRRLFRTHLQACARASGYIRSGPPRTAGTPDPHRASEPRRPLRRRVGPKEPGELGGETCIPSAKEDCLMCHHG
ncbi:MAG: sigma factor-like helix-turn-helix DNA-binding protein, partial [Candidatus Tectomicrobia bacterium]